MTETRKWIEISAMATLIECPVELSSSVYDAAKAQIMDAIRQAYNRGLGEAARIVEETQEVVSSADNKRSVYPRYQGNLVGIAYAIAIREKVIAQ